MFELQGTETGPEASATAETWQLGESEACGKAMAATDQAGLGVQAWRFLLRGSLALLEGR